MIILWNTNTLYVHCRYKTLAGAKGARTKLIAKEHRKAEEVKARGRTPNDPNDYSVGTVDDYNAADYEVERVNLMTNKSFKIKMSQVGGSCDPSTERYWTM